jgi:antitoxin (DNA-binding transcriptional repressor) of toxin-antitoxin stability system
MVTVSIRDVETRFSELAEKAEAGETIVITRDGRPVLDLVVHKPEKPRDGLNVEALGDYKRKYGIDKIVALITDDFDDPLPEDFLIQPLPQHL